MARLSHPARKSNGYTVRTRWAYQFLLGDQEDAGVCLQVDAGGSTDDVETFDRDIRLIGKAEPYEVEHDLRYLHGLIPTRIREFP